MAKKKGKTKTIVKYRQSKPKVKYRTRWKEKRVYRKAKSTLGGLNMGAVVKGVVPMFFGAMVCKFCAKKFAEGGADNENWNWKNYAWGLGGTAAAGLLSAAVFKGKGKIAQGMIQGGLLLFLYKVFVNEVAPRSEYLTSWFGEDEDIYGLGDDDDDIYADDEYGDDELHPEYGDIYQGETPEDDVVYGVDGRYRPVSEMHRMTTPQVAPQAGYGVDIEPADPSFGVDIEPADPSFGVDIEPADPSFGATDLTKLYDKAYAGF